MKNSAVISMLCLAVLLALFTPSLGKYYIPRISIFTLSKNSLKNGNSNIARLRIFRGKVHVVQMEIKTVSSEFWGNMQQARCPEKFDVLMLGIIKANALVRLFVQKI
ncbi:hypothetical protein Pfo_020965, partial [Paulownia fortunei]